MKKKLTVNISEEIVTVLRDLAQRDGTTLTEEIKRSISDRKFFTDKVTEGYRIALHGEDSVTYVEFR